MESIDLDRGTPMMYRDFGAYVRLAHDPAQIDETAALALLCTYVPRLAGQLSVIREGE
ncbi:hypothetical protein ACIQGT_40205 [Streptomyces sp. NPDC093108]|uniref:hypothetical protein n=1 Tax=unclassified Streptomyces TaxID=2593676 RepID=UPI003823B9B4